MAKFSEEQRHYIKLLQDVINRMAGNSANCKTWLLTIVVAVITFSATKDVTKVVLLMLIGTDVLFYFLDVYYLYLERQFRLIENRFVNDEKPEGVADRNILLYSFGAKNELTRKDKVHEYIEALTSFSTWSLYLAVLIVLIILYFIL